MSALNDLLLFLCVESHQFISKPSSVVCSCCFMTPPHSSRPNSRVLLYCAKSSLPVPSSSSPPSPSHTPYGYHVILRRCEVGPGGSFILGQSSVLLDGCPLFDLVGFSGGVCLVPTQGPYPKGLLLFWAPGRKAVVMCVHVHVYVHMCVCMRVCMYVCIYVCVYV